MTHWKASLAAMLILIDCDIGDKSSEGRSPETSVPANETLKGLSGGEHRVDIWPDNPGAKRQMVRPKMIVFTYHSIEKPCNHKEIKGYQ
jgi:hypothetical protein